MVEPDSSFHVAIKVPDVDDSLAFYRDLLGGEVVDRGRPEATDGPDATAVEYAALAVGDKRVYLFDRAPYEAAGLVEEVSTGVLHVGFVVDDVDSAATELREAGAEFPNGSDGLRRPPDRVLPGSGRRPDRIDRGAGLRRRFVRADGSGVRR